MDWLLSTFICCVIFILVSICYRIYYEKYNKFFVEVKYILKYIGYNLVSQLKM